MNLVEKTDYKYSDQKVIVGGHYLNDLLLQQNNSNLEGGGRGKTAIYSKLENYGVPAGLYVSPHVSNIPRIHKIETIIVKQYDCENMRKLFDNLDTGVIKNLDNKTRKKDLRGKNKKTRKGQH
jgi:hypothetical protein